MGMCCLTWAQPCQDQCLSPVGVAEPPQVRLRRTVKPSWGPSANVDSVCRTSTIASSPDAYNLKTAPYGDRPCLLVQLYSTAPPPGLAVCSKLSHCLTIIRNVISFQTLRLLPQRARTPNTSSLCPFVCPSFIPLRPQSGQVP